MSVEAVKTYSRVIKKGVVAVWDQAFFSATHFIISVLLTHWLPEDQYGAYAFAYSIFLLLAGFYTVLITEPLSIFGSAQYRSVLGRYTSQQALLHCILSVAVALLGLLIVAVYAVINPHSVLIGALAGLSIGHGAMLFLWFVRRALYIEQRVGRALQASILYAILSVTSIWVLNGQELLSPFAAFLTMAGAAIVASLFAMGRETFRPATSRPTEFTLIGLARENFIYAQWMIVATITVWLMSNAYYVLSGTFLSLEDTATLKALQNLTLPISQVIAALGLLFIPWASRRYWQSGKTTLRTDTNLFVVATGLITTVYFALLLLTQKQIFAFLYDNRYSEYRAYLPYLALVTLLQVLPSAWSQSLRIVGKTQNVFLIDAAGAVFTVTIGIILVAQLGFDGLITAMLFSVITRLPVALFLWNRASRSDEGG